MVQQIIVPKVSGVYMLGELKHKTEDRRWHCGFVYYIGQSADVVQRLIEHRRVSQEFENAEMVLLSKDKESDRSLKNEGRFIAAAVEMCIPLRNRMIVKPTRGECLEKKKRILAEAIDVFHGITKTEWQHPDKFLRCAYKAAAA